MASAPDTLRDRAERYSPPQQRTLEVALALFAEHGVGGTSFQMVADELGVTKAAVYHQFRTKDAIVHGVLEVQLAPLEAALDAAEVGTSRRAREELLDRLIDAAMVNRQALATLQNDPVLFRLLGANGPARLLFERLYGVLLSGLDGPVARVRAAVLSAAVGSVGSAFVAEVDDDTLRDELRRIGRRLLRP